MFPFCDSIKSIKVGKIGTISRIGKKKTLKIYGRDDTVRTVRFKASGECRDWEVTSSDPFIASGYVGDKTMQKSGGIKYTVWILPGSRKGTATITARARDGSGRQLKWKVKNYGDVEK